MVKIRLFVLCILLTPSLHAAIGPERFLTGLGASIWSVAYDGTSYVAVWRETAGTFAGRIDERGDPIGDRIMLSENHLTQALAVAADQGSVVAVWGERSSAGDYDLFMRWLNGPGSPVQTIGHFPTSPFTYSWYSAVAATAAEGKFVIAFRLGSRDWIDVMTFAPGSLTPSTTSRVSSIFSEGVAIESNRSALLFVWGHLVPSGFVGPPGCCYEPALVAMTADTSAVPTASPIAFDDIREVPPRLGRTPWGTFVVPTGMNEWRQATATLLMISPEGQLRERRRLPFLLFPATAPFGDSLYVTARTSQRVGVGDLYLAEVRQFDVESQRGLYSIHTSTMTDHSQITAGRKTLLVSYELVGPVGQRGIAYQMVDPASLPALPARPAVPRVVSSLPGPTAETTIGWEPPAPGTRYRLQVEVVKGYGYPIDRLIDPSTTTTVVTMYPDQEYRITLVAENNEGRSPASEVVRFRSPAFGRPRSPSGASGAFRGDGMATISWVDNSSNEDGFRVTASPYSANPVVLANVPANTERVTVVVPAGALAVGVTAYNSSGSSELVYVNLTAAPRPRSVRH